MEGEEPKRLQLSATGPAEVKAGDITVSGDIEVMNNEIKEVLSSMGLRLGMDIPGWPPENIEEMAKKLEQELLG